MLMFRLRRGLRFRASDTSVWMLDRFTIARRLQFICEDGLIQTLTEAELLTRWHKHEWILDPTSVDRNQHSVFTTTARDLAALSQSDRAIAAARHAAIAPLIGQRYITNLELTQRAKDLVGAGSFEKLDARTLRRWLARYKVGGDITALANMKPQRRPRAQGRLIELFETSVNNAYLRKERPNRLKVFDELMRLITKHNESVPAFEAIKRPSRATVYRRMCELDVLAVDKARLGRFEANKKHRTALKHVSAKSLLARVELDHQRADVILVDPDSGKALGRPWVTLAIDTYSRLILGFHITFDAPCSNSVLQCLKLAILPKTSALASFPDIQNRWPALGFMSLIVLDNAMEFHGEQLRNFCQEIGCSIQYSPSRSPWFRGVGERMFGTANTGLMHQLPGTTFSNTKLRAGYASEKLCQLTRHDFIHILTRWIVDVYHVRPHRMTQMPPLVRWEEQALTRDFDLPASPADLDLLAAHRTERKLQHYGIELERVFYNSPALQDLHRILVARKRNGSGTETVHVRFHEDTIEHVEVLDPLTNSFLRVPALEGRYDIAVDRHTHRAVIASLNRRFGPNWKDSDRRNALAAINEVVSDAGKSKSRVTRAAMRDQRKSARNRCMTSAPNKRRQSRIDEVMIGKSADDDALPDLSEFDEICLRALEGK